MTLTCRQASFLDFPALWSLYVEMLKQYPDTLERLTSFGLATIAHQVNGWLLDRDVAVFMAFDGELAVGFGVVQVGGPMQVGDEMILTGAHLWVLPDYGNGAAETLLCCKAYGVAKRLRAKAFQVVAREENGKLRDFLARHHFKPRGVVYERRLGDA
jgi:hypothetical protein